MKVYVSELPEGKDIRCEIDSMVLAIDMSDKDKSYLMIGDKEQDNNFRVEFCSDNEILVNCIAKILEHLADYTKQVRKEVLEQVYKVFTNEDVWKELKDWWLGNGNCKELKKCLDAMIEEKSVENIAKKFGHYKNFYQQLDLIQGEDK